MYNNNNNIIIWKKRQKFSLAAAAYIRARVPKRIYIVQHSTAMTCIQYKNINGKRRRRRAAFWRSGGGAVEGRSQNCECCAQRRKRAPALYWFVAFHNVSAVSSCLLQVWCIPRLLSVFAFFEGTTAVGKIFKNKKKKKKTSIDYIDEGVTTAVCRLSWKKEATHILFFKTFSFDPFFSGATPVNLIDIIFLSYYFLFILCAENYRNHYAVYVWVVLATV